MASALRILPVATLMVGALVLVMGLGPSLGTEPPLNETFALAGGGLLVAGVVGLVAVGVSDLLR